MKVYAFKYCPCIHEGTWAVVSLHTTKKGAEQALKNHARKALREFNETFKDDPELKEIMKFGEHESWGVEEIEVLD